MLCMDAVTTFASPTGRTSAASTTPLPTFVAGAQADVRGTLVAVHFRDERGFAIFSLEQADGSRIRALGYLPPDVTLRAVVRVGGTWTRRAQYGLRQSLERKCPPRSGDACMSAVLHAATGLSGAPWRPRTRLARIIHESRR